MTNSLTPRASGLRRWRQTRLGLLFISPWAIGFAVFYVYPFFATLYYSFTRFTGVGYPGGPGVWT
jgi:multiple sugar transport system permease protein